MRRTNQAEQSAPSPTCIKIQALLNLKRLFAGLNGEDADHAPGPAREDRLPESGIVEFYGKWCGYCRMIDPAVVSIFS